MTSNNNVSAPLTSADNKTVIIKTFNKFEEAIEKGDIEYLKTLIDFLYKTGNKATLEGIYKDEINTIRDTHIITLACKYNQLQVLEFFLHKSNIIYYLPVDDNSYVQALCNAIILQNTQMLEVLYDFISGDIHWLGIDENRANNGKVHILTKLRRLLDSARDICEEHLEQNIQIRYDVNCLLDFNFFQIELYSQLSTANHNTQGNERMNETEAIRSDLLITLNLYDQYSRKILSYAAKKCCSALCYMCYFSYDVYYRKLDYNAALIIANNIHSLKLRLNLSVDVYQEIECAIYYFLYRVNDNWKLYLPENIPKYGNLCHGELNRDIAIATLSYHNIGTVIHKEWVQFKRHLRNFKDVLEKVDVKKNLREKGTKVPEKEVNQLSISPYDALRDNFSLRNILHYLEIASHVDFKQDKMNSILIIQRVLQMTGEFLKGTDITCHLSPTTLALLQIEMSKEIYKLFSGLRISFSKALGGKLLKRIYIELNDSQIFEDIIKDLDALRKVIHEFISTTYTPLIESHLLKLGLELLNKRYASLPPEILTYDNDIRKIYDDSRQDWKQFLELEKQFLRKNIGLTKILFREILFLGITKQELNKKVDEKNNLIKESLIKNIPKYTNTILESCNIIAKQNNIWNSIRSNYVSICPNINLLDYPTSDNIAIINKTKLKKNQKAPEIIALKQKLKDENIRDCYKEWCELKNIITFIIDQTKALSFDERKYLELSTLYQKLNNNPDNFGIYNVRLLIKRLKKYLALNTSLTQVQLNPYRYETLKNLANKMKMTTKMSSQWLKCLVNRMDSINNVLNGERDIDKLILRYLHDVSFRIVLEMLVSDIMNIYNDLKLNKLMNIAYTKLHTEFPLRNILNHGSSLLDIFSVSFDVKDYPKALITFVLEVARDRPHINDLYLLYTDRVKRDDIELIDLPDTLNKNQKDWVENFKQCPNWEEYFQYYYVS